MSDIKEVDISENKKKTKKSCIWVCTKCDKECFPIREQSWCLCGHRYQSHSSETFKCNNKRCDCPHFFYIVAQGHWFLRCRCKHKHTEHHPNKPNFPCKRNDTGKCASKCEGFDSPWVCNCDHKWIDHEQRIVEKNVNSLENLMRDFQKIDMVKR